MICKNCGYKNDEDAKFCEQCGTQIEQKKKVKKSKKIFLSILSVFFIIILIAYGSRFLFFVIASNRIDDMADNPSCFDSLFLYDDFIEINITDNYLKPYVLYHTTYSINLNIYTDSDTNNCVSYYSVADIDNFGVSFNRDEVTYWDDIDRTLYDHCSFNFEDGTIYKICVDIGVYPLNSEIFYEIDRLIGGNTTHSATIEAYFLYENGEFIKVNQ